MKMFSPRGGVENPTPQQQTSTTPKWMGSTPKAVMTGRSTGVASRMIASVSMNIPRKSSRAMANIQMTATSEVKPRMCSTIMSGIRYWTSSRSNA